MDTLNFELHAYHLEAGLQEVARWLAGASVPLPETKTWPKLVLTGTLTVTIEREPSPGYEETMARLKAKQQELAEQSGIVKILPEGS